MKQPINYNILSCIRVYFYGKLLIKHITMRSLTLFLVLLTAALAAFTSFVLGDAGVPGVQHASFVSFLPLILSALGTAYSVYSTEDSKNKAEKEYKKQQKELEKRRSDYEAWFKGEYGQDFLDTEMGRSTVNQLGSTLKNTLQNQQTGAVRGGLTTEAQVAQKGAAQDVYATALNQLTGLGTQYKQNMRNSYDYRIQNYLQPLDAMAMQRIGNYGQYGAQTAETSQSLVNALAGMDWNSLFGGGGGYKPQSLPSSYTVGYGLGG